MAGARDIIRHRSQAGKIQSAETQTALEKDEKARSKAEKKGGAKNKPSERRKRIGKRTAPPREYVKQHRRIPADKMLREQGDNKDVSSGNTVETLRFSSVDVAERATELGLTDEVLRRWNPADARRGFTHGDLMFIKTEEDAEAAKKQAAASQPPAEGQEPTP